jgi:autonomous glycyl radical cofactor GrcA
MASRMEKYYSMNNDLDVPKRRVEKNQDLYGNLYEDYEVENNITKISNTGEIDFNKVRQMLNKEDESLLKPIKPSISVKEQILEEKNYDIREILKEAKENHKDDFPKVNIEDIKANQKLDNLEDETRELKELIHTITSVSKIAKNDEDDSFFTLLNDLKATSVIESDAINKIVNEQVKEELAREEPKVDESFYTTTIPLKNDDLEEETKKPEKKNNLFIKILGYILLVLITSFAILGSIILLR